MIEFESPENLIDFYHKHGVAALYYKELRFTVKKIDYFTDSGEVNVDQLEINNLKAIKRRCKAELSARNWEWMKRIAICLSATSVTLHLLAK